MDKKICGTLIAALFLSSAFVPLIAASESGEMLTDEAKYPWTVMIFTDMDNIQFGMFPTDLWGLTWVVLRYASYLMPSNIPVIALYDGMTDGDSKLLSLSEKKVLNDGGAVIPESGEVNYGDPETMVNFIKWTTENYPAEHYLFAICHHYGWEGYNPDESSPGPIGMDTITLPETKYALEKAGVHFDVLWIEACAGTEIENLYQYAPFFDYIVANEDMCDFMEMALRPIVVLDKLSQNPEMTPKQVAITLAEYYPLLTTSLLTNQLSPIMYAISATSPSTKPEPYRVFPLTLKNIWTPTQFAIESKGVIEVAMAVDALASFMRDNLEDLAPVIQSAREGTKEYSLFPWYIDLYVFAERLCKITDDEMLKSKCQDVMNAVDKAVIATRKLPFDSYRGILIQFPLTAREYASEMCNEFDPTTTYWDIEFAKDTQWDEFLQAYFEKVPSGVVMPFLRNNQPIGAAIYAVLQLIIPILEPILAVAVPIVGPIVSEIYSKIAEIIIHPPA